MGRNFGDYSIRNQSIDIVGHWLLIGRNSDLVTLLLSYSSLKPTIALSTTEIYCMVLSVSSASSLWLMRHLYFRPKEGCDAKGFASNLVCWTSMFCFCCVFYPLLVVEIGCRVLVLIVGCNCRWCFVVVCCWLPSGIVDTRGSPHSNMGETGVRIDCELLVDFLQNQKPQISQLPTFADFCHQC
jgi:hypothetical protein